MAKSMKMGKGKPAGGAKSALAGLGRALAMRAALGGAGGPGGPGGPGPMGAGAPPAPPAGGAGPDMSGGAPSGAPGMKKGGKVVKKACSGGGMRKASGGLLPSKKADDGIARKGKTRAMGARDDSGPTVKETTGKKKGGVMKKYAKGGLTTGNKSDSGPTVKETTGKKKGGVMKKYASGGSVFRSSARGIESKGKTKTKVC